MNSNTALAAAEPTPKSDVSDVFTRLARRLAGTTKKLPAHGYNLEIKFDEDVEQVEISAMSKTHLFKLEAYEVTDKSYAAVEVQVYREGSAGALTTLRQPATPDELLKHLVEALFKYIKDKTGRATAAAEPHATQGGLAGVMERLRRALGGSVGSVNGSRLTLTPYLYIDVSSTPTMHADGLAEVLVRFAGYPCYGTTVAFAGDDDPKAYRITSVVHAVKSILRVARAAALESKDLDVFSTRVGMDLRELQRRSYNEAVRDSKYVEWAPTDYTMYWNVKNKNQHPSAWRALRAAYETLKQRTAPKVEAAAEPRGAKSSPALGALAQRYSHSESHAVRHPRRLGDRLLLAYATEFLGNMPGLIIGITDEHREKWYMFHIRELPGGIVLRYMYRIKAIYLDDVKIQRPLGDRSIPRGMLDKEKSLVPDVLLSKAFTIALGYVKYIESEEAKESNGAGATAAAEPQADPEERIENPFTNLHTALLRKYVMKTVGRYKLEARAIPAGHKSEPGCIRVNAEPLSNFPGARSVQYKVLSQSTHGRTERRYTMYVYDGRRLVLRHELPPVADPAAQPMPLLRLVLSAITSDLGMFAQASAEPDASTPGSALRELLRSLRSRRKQTFFVSNIPVQISVNELNATICVGDPKAWHQNIIGRTLIGASGKTAHLSIEGGLSELVSTDPAKLLREALTKLVAVYNARIKTTSASAEPSSLDVTSADGLFEYMRTRCHGTGAVTDVSIGSMFSVGPVLSKTPQTATSIGNSKLPVVEVIIAPSAAYDTDRPVISVKLLDRSLVLQIAPDDRVGVDRVVARILAAARETIQAAKKADTSAEFAALVQAVGLKYHFFDKFARGVLRPAACQYNLPYDPKPHRNWLSASNEIDMLWDKIHGGRAEAAG